MFDRKFNQLSQQLAAVSSKLDKVLALLAANQQTTQKELTEILMDLTALTASVANTTTVEQSAVVLIQGLSSQLAAAGTDPAALAALQSQLDTQASALAAAVAANTPASTTSPA